MRVGSSLYREKGLCLKKSSVGKWLAPVLPCHKPVCSSTCHVPALGATDPPVPVSWQQFARKSLQYLPEGSSLGFSCSWPDSLMAHWEDGWGYSPGMWKSYSKVSSWPETREVVEMQKMCTFNSCREGLWLRSTRKTVNRFPGIEIFLEEMILLFQLILEIKSFLNVFVIHAVFWKRKSNVMKPCLKIVLICF